MHNFLWIFKNFLYNLLFFKNLLTYDLQYAIIITVENTKHKIKKVRLNIMKKFVDKLINKYGFEHPVVIFFAKFVR